METTNTNNESLKGVRILRSYYEGLDEFTYEEKGRMFEAIMEYGLNGAEPNFDGAADARALRGIWITYLPIINNSISRAIASGKNGTKGGAPVKKSKDVVEASKISTENKAPESTITTKMIPEDLEEEIVAEIEEKDDITQLEYLLTTEKYPQKSDINKLVEKIFNNITELYQDSIADDIESQRKKYFDGSLNIQDYITNKKIECKEYEY